MEQSREILKKFWNYDGFRPLQEDIVDSVIYGNDVLALLPTGGGKSICFQVPGIAREGICIVISPLIALMQDQVQQLQQRGIRAMAITSAMSYREIDTTLDNARFGGIEFLYVSPERLQTKLFMERFKLMKIGLLVVDEAHCISEWGHDFRPSYRNISKLRSFFPKVPMMAVTATATQEVKEDIIQQLELRNCKVFVASFLRANISYEVYQVANKFNAIERVIRQFDNQTGVIYCQKRKSVKKLAQHLLSKGVKIGIYHGGMDAKSRTIALEAWLSNQFKIMIATNAFGMGIDKPDVRFVAHYEFPNNPEALFQEAGRAGRDGKEARTFVFYNETEFPEIELQLKKQFPSLESIRNCYHLLGNFFRIAIGSGEGESFPFNIRDFVSQYNLDYLDTFYALKFLELSDYIILSDSIHHPTKAKFIVNHTTLYNFQLNHDSLVKITTFLTRSFPGIFEEYMDIQDENSSKRLKMTLTEMERQLSFLEKNGIIDISWKSDTPFIYYKQGRLPKEHVSIEGHLYNARKQAVFKRWETMKEYVTQRKICHSQFLIKYFGQTVERCGKCDICKEIDKSSSEIKCLNRLSELLHKETTIDNIYTNFDVAEKQLIDQLIKQLIDEDKLIISGQFLKLKA